MKHVAFILLLATAHFSAFSQPDLIRTATDLIVLKKYTAANRYLDSVLKTDPARVDALMMKGNVILNRATTILPPQDELTKSDETIFSRSLPVKDAVVLPFDTVQAIEGFWRKCLRLDSSRNDIRKGLCTVYAMALMKDSLKKEISALVNNENNEDGEQAYRLAEYARKFKERNRFEGAMEIYKHIAGFFPDVAGLKCDMAAEYFYAGRMNEALIWLDSTFKQKKVDETTFLNGAFLYSELGYFGDALNVLDHYSRIYQRNMDKFYYGLTLFADSIDLYYEVLDTFVLYSDSNAYANEVYLARKLLPLRDSFALNQYQLLVGDQNIPDYYKVLIHARALRQFPNKCEPFVVYGVFQCYIKNYLAAIQYLEEGEGCELNPELAEFWLLAYGYTLMNFDKPKALSYLQRLYDSKNSFYAQAARYFSIPVLIDQKQGDKAEKLLKELLAAKEKTKYADLVNKMIANSK